MEKSVSAISAILVPIYTLIPAKMYYRPLDSFTASEVIANVKLVTEGWHDSEVLEHSLNYGSRIEINKIRIVKSEECLLL